MLVNPPGAAESRISPANPQLCHSLSCRDHPCGPLAGELGGSPGRELLLVFLSPMFRLLLLSFPHLMEKSGLIEQLAPVSRAAFPSLCTKFCNNPPPRDALLMLSGSCPLLLCPFTALPAPIQVPTAAPSRPLSDFGGVRCCPCFSLHSLLLLAASSAFSTVPLGLGSAPPATGSPPPPAIAFQKLP